MSNVVTNICCTLGGDDQTSIGVAMDKVHTLLGNLTGWHRLGIRLDEQTDCGGGIQLLICAATLCRPDDQLVIVGLARNLGHILGILPTDRTYWIRITTEAIDPPNFPQNPPSFGGVR